MNSDSFFPSSLITDHLPIDEIINDAKYDSVRNASERFIRDAGLKRDDGLFMYVNGRRVPLRVDVCNFFPLLFHSSSFLLLFFGGSAI